MLTIIINRRSLQKSGDHQALCLFPKENGTNRPISCAVRVSNEGDMTVLTIDCASKAKEQGSVKRHFHHPKGPQRSISSDERNTIASAYYTIGSEELARRSSVSLSTISRIVKSKTASISGPMLDAIVEVAKEAVRDA